MMCILDNGKISVTISVKEKQNKVDLGFQDNETKEVALKYDKPCCAKESLLDVYQFWKDYYLRRKYELKVEEE